MQIIDYPTPNYDSTKIDVQFCIIHYSALDLKDTLHILSNAEKKVSAHFVISPTGQIYQLVPALTTSALRAWHAGVSKWVEKGTIWKNFNDYSIGIELINLNGNILTYPKKQYLALAKLIIKLQQQYPQLMNPDRILGHEHIAWFRGKIDPGLQFNWTTLIQQIFATKKSIKRNSVIEFLLDKGYNINNFNKDVRINKYNSANINSDLESEIALIFQNNAYLKI